MLNTAGVRAGETVAVIGCGGVGLSAIQGARIAGAGRIIAVDMVDSEAEAGRVARRHRPRQRRGRRRRRHQVIELTGGGVDHAFEAIGLKIAAEQAFGMIRRAAAPPPSSA